MIKERVACRSDKVGKVLKTVRREYAEWPMDIRDGLKVTLQDGWFLVRASNTEPIIRLVAESETEESVRRMIEDLQTLVRGCLDA